MNENVRTYSIHNLLTFKVRFFADPIRSFLSRAYDEHEYFRTEIGPSPDFEVSFGRFDPRKRRSYKYGSQIEATPTYLLVKEDNYKLARWSLEVDGFADSSSSEIRCNANLAGSMFASSFIVDNYARFLLSLKGYPTIHASAVAGDRDAILFAGPSGAGKTSIALRLVENGYKFLADNYVILGRDNVYSFPTPLNMFGYNIAPDMRSDLSSSKRARLEISQIIYNATKEKVKLFLRLKPWFLFPGQITNTASHGKIIILSPGKDLRLRRMDQGVALNFLLLNCQAESYPLTDYIAKHVVACPESPVSSYWNDYCENLSECMKDMEFFSLSFPRNSIKKSLDLVLDSID